MMKPFQMLMIWMLTLAACQNEPANEPAGQQAPRPEPYAIEGMRNAVRYGDLLFGGQPSEEALERLAAEGYRTVLSARGPDETGWDEKAKVEALGMKFVRIPMTRPVETISDEQVARLDSLLKEGERPMVMHCGSGNRVAGLWAVWLVERQGMEREAALDLAAQTGMKGVRPVVEKRLGISKPRKTRKNTKK